MINRFTRLKESLVGKPSLLTLSGIIAGLCIAYALAQHSAAGEALADPSPKEPAPLAELREETLSYFAPVSGRIVAVEGGSLRLSADPPQSLRPGMRLNAFKEGVNYVHPVTKEPLGKMETPVGGVEVTAAGPDGAAGRILSGKPGDFTHASVKIPATKVKMLFYQGDVDWVLGDSYYQLLKESGRFALIDTGIETSDITKIMAEAKAKGAEAVLVLGYEETKDSLSLEQKLYWTGDSRQFSAKKVSVDASRIKELRFKAGAFGLREGEVLLRFHLPFGAKRLAVGDLDGDGEPEIILVSGDDVRVYKPGVDLRATADFKVPSADDVLWIDCVDNGKNKRDNLVITSMKGSEITSYLYELQDSKFVQLAAVRDVFLRKLGSELVAQRYTRSDGYTGSVYSVSFAGGAYRKGADLKLPEDVNIYDFQYLNSPDGRQAVLAWDEKGYLNLYNDKGIRTWVSNSDFGGFFKTFKRESPTVMADRGQWSIKDRLVIRGGEILAPKRKPFFGLARGLGYSNSEIRSLWWNGINVEENPFIEKFGGNVLDYYPVGDRIVVLAKVPWLTKAQNLIKGESPFGVMLYVFSTRGR